MIIGTKVVCKPRVTSHSLVAVSDERPVRFGNYCHVQINANEYRSVNMWAENFESWHDKMTVYLYENEHNKWCLVDPYEIDDGWTHSRGIYCVGYSQPPLEIVEHMLGVMKEYAPKNELLKFTDPFTYHLLKREIMHNGYITGVFSKERFKDALIERFGDIKGTEYFDYYEENKENVSV